FPLIFVGLLQVDPTPLAMATPSLSQHFLMMEILRGETPVITDLLLSVSVTALIGTSLCWIAGRLYEREAILG
ncbi:MAG: hypothetical protein ACKOIB_05795, partial [Verrucomicrobiota bacterium]